MATIRMREINEGEIPFAAGTAVQDAPDRPTFTGNGPNDYICVKCGNLLAHAMHPIQMNEKLRVKCAVCGTINVAIQPDEEDAEQAVESAEPVEPEGVQSAAEPSAAESDAA